MTVICCSDIPYEIGEKGIGQIWCSEQDKWINVISEIVREATKDEYLDFCEKQDAIVDFELLPYTPFFYEVRIYD